MGLQLEKPKNTTVYKIDYSDAAVKPEAPLSSLK